MSRPPVVLFVYRRPNHTQRTLEALSRCSGAAETDLFIYSDGPKAESDRPKVDEVRSVCQNAAGFGSVSIHEAPSNQGLASSVISGVTEVLGRFGACIVVEDDLTVSPRFLDFLAGALERYQSEPLVFSLSGYAPPPGRVPVDVETGVWFAPRPSSWGWAIWKDRWDQIDWQVRDADRLQTDSLLRKAFDRGGRDLSYFLRLQLRGELDSWAVRMAWTQARLGGLTAYPARSFVANEGLDGSGTHSVPQADQRIELTDAVLPTLWPAPVMASEAVLRRFRRHYEGTWTERWGHRWRKARKLFLGLSR